MDFYCFDYHGGYLGRLSDEGAFFGPDGAMAGRLAECGGLYELGGRHLGRINAQGSYFAPDGTCRGYVRNWSPPWLPRPAGAQRSAGDFFI